ncbi:hypothetical protein [Nitrosomonas sp. wSCUT-2]
MNQLEPYHFIAYGLWLRGNDLSTLYPSRAFKKHCEAIKSVLGVDVSAPRTFSILAELEGVAATATTQEETERLTPALAAQSEALADAEGINPGAFNYRKSNPCQGRVAACEPLTA